MCVCVYMCCLKEQMSFLPSLLLIMGTPSLLVQEFKMQRTQPSFHSETSSPSPSSNLAGRVQAADSSQRLSPKSSPAPSPRTARSEFFQTTASHSSTSSTSNGAQKLSRQSRPQHGHPRDASLSNSGSGKSFLSCTLL